MRLSCQLTVCNQLAPANPKKACVSTLALCKDKNNLPILLVCTKQNVAGQKYEVKKLKKVFSKFLKDGMATLSFCAPPHDLLIKKADPLQLRSFLHFLSKGEETNLRFSAPPTRIEAPPPKKLVVTSRGDIPNPFPKSLESLTITGIGLLRAPSSVWRLDQLTSLNLCENALECLPLDLSSLSRLKVLNVSNNKLTSVHAVVNLRVLQVLNASFNQLTLLPEHLCRLDLMVDLNVSNNNLARLPYGIGRLRKLRNLDASSNKIEILPSSAMRLRLDFLKLNKNPLSRAVTSTHHRAPPSLPSLKEWAAQSTLHHRLPYSANCVPYTLVAYLNSDCQFCALCSRPVFTSDSPAVIDINIMQISAAVETLDNLSRVTAPIEIVKCFNHSQQVKKSARIVGRNVSS